MGARVRHAQVPTSAVFLIMGSVLCFTLLDTITKFTTSLYPVPMLVWARYLVQLLAMLIWLGPSMRLSLLHTRHLPLQLVRGCLLLLSSLLFVNALHLLPLADATAINYSTAPRPRATPPTPPSATAWPVGLPTPRRSTTPPPCSWCCWPSSSCASA